MGRPADIAVPPTYRVDIEILLGTHGEEDLHREVAAWTMAAALRKAAALMPEIEAKYAKDQHFVMVGTVTVERKA